MDEFNIIVENEEPIDVTTDIQNDFLRGEKGPKGDSNTLTIGTVQKGEEANASIEGDAPNQILNLTLPKGDKGDKPEKGIDYFTTEEKQEIVQEVVKEVNAFDIKIVEELPIEDIRTKVIYFVPKVNEEEQNVYDEYIYINNQWEHIGSTKVDLTDYYKREETDEIVNEKAIVDKPIISGKTSQEGTPSPTNIVPIKNVNVYGVNLINLLAQYEAGHTMTSNGLTITFNADGSITANGTTTAITHLDIFGTWGGTTSYCNLNLNKEYYLNCNMSNKLGLTFRDKNNSKTSYSWGVQSGMATVTELMLSFPTNTTYNNQKIFIKLEEGTEATTYTQYGYGLLDLNLQKDTDTQTVTLISKRLHEDDSVDECGFHYKRKTRVFNGTESWTYNKSSDGLNRFYLTVNDILVNTTEIISTHFKYENANAYGNIFCGGSLGNLVYILIDLETVDELKSYLAEQYANGTPVTIEYPLATIEDEQFNETNQTAWNTLEDLLLQGYTFIDSSSDELQPTVTLTEYTANEIYRENVDKFKKLEKKHIYSTEETILGKWIDGKRIYRKVIDFGDLPNTTSKVVAHNILNVNQIINIQAIAKLKTSPYSTMILDSCDPDGLKYSTHIAVDKNNITILTGSDRSSLTAFVILEYTKTND